MNGTLTPSRKIHSGPGYRHEDLPQLPCSRRPAQHLRNNNLLGLQAALQCGTIHHACSGVTLRKPTDDRPGWSFGNGKTRVDLYLRQWDGPITTQARYDLARNDLNGLSELFYLCTNDPTPGQ